MQMKKDIGMMQSTQMGHIMRMNLNTWMKPGMMSMLKGYEEDVEYTSEYDAEVENTEQQAMASGYTEESGYNEENQYTEGS